MTFACLLARGDRGLKSLEHMFGEQGLQGRAVASGEGGDDEAEGGFRLERKFGGSKCGSRLTICISFWPSGELGSGTVWPVCAGRA